MTIEKQQIKEEKEITKLKDDVLLLKKANNLAIEIVELLEEQDADEVISYLEWLKLKTKMRLNPELQKSFPLFKGGIYYCNLGKAVGAEIEKERPCILIWGYPDSETIIVVPCSEDEKYIGSTFWYHVPISTGGTALVEQIRTISKTCITNPFRLGRKILAVNEDEMKKIDFAINKLKFKKES